MQVCRFTWPDNTSMGMESVHAPNTPFNALMPPGPVVPTETSRKGPVEATAAPDCRAAKFSTSSPAQKLLPSPEMTTTRTPGSPASRLMAHWRAVLPEGAMLEVQYEDLVDDFEVQARRIVEFCGLDWDERCLAFYKTERSVHTASAAQVRQPLYRSSIGRWRHYKEQLRPLLDL